jgi:hypothetical protein
MGREAQERLAGGASAQPDVGRDGSDGGLRAHQLPMGRASCDLCRRTILVGEEIGHFRREDRLLTVCPLCAGRLLTQGSVRAA